MDVWARMQSESQAKKDSIDKLAAEVVAVKDTVKALTAVMADAINTVKALTAAPSRGVPRIARAGRKVRKQHL
jgi:hypothetical protein